jgi:hypothetical protein
VSRLDGSFNKNLCAINNARSMWIKPFEAQWKTFFNYMLSRPYNKMA